MTRSSTSSGNNSSSSSNNIGISITTRSNQKNTIITNEVVNKHKIINTRKKKLNSIQSTGELSFNDNRVKLNESTNHSYSNDNSYSKETISPLPSLLSHLSLTNQFPITTTINNNTATNSTSTSSSSDISSSQFNFPPPLLSPYQQPYPQSYSHHSHHQHYYSTPFQSASTSISPPATNQEKRPSNILGPIPHLFSRTKKRKLVHRFFRSEALFSGPPPPPPSVSSTSTSSSSSPNISPPPLSPPSSNSSISKSPSPPTSNFLSTLPSPSSPSTSTCSSSSSTTTTAIQSTTVYVPIHPRQPPSWWASVSRDGTESKMIPEEGSWVGDGNGWEFVELPASSIWKGKGRESDVDMLQEERLEGELLDAEFALEQEKDSRQNSRGGGKWNLRDRLGWNSSNNNNHSHHTIAGQGGAIGNGANNAGANAAPLKQHLLAVLRMRLREGGGSSKGGEAGLRFKKWVVWNSWMKKTTLPLPTLSSDDPSTIPEDLVMEETLGEGSPVEQEEGEEQEESTMQGGEPRIRMKRNHSNTSSITAQHRTSSIPIASESTNTMPSDSLIGDWEDSTLFSDVESEVSSFSNGHSLHDQDHNQIEQGVKGEEEELSLSPSSTCPTTPELMIIEIERNELDLHSIQTPQSPRQSNRILPIHSSSSSSPSSSSSLSSSSIILETAPALASSSLNQYSINSRPRRTSSHLSSISTASSSSSPSIQINSSSISCRPSLKRGQSLPSLNGDTTYTHFELEVEESSLVSPGNKRKKSTAGSVEIGLLHHSLPLPSSTSNSRQQQQKVRSSSRNGGGSGSSGGNISPTRVVEV